VFETLAFLTTIALFVVFVMLIQMDRAGRTEENPDNTPRH
jgi:hypothetical protein